MYDRSRPENTMPTTTRTSSTRYVADILSSMANGEPAAPTYTLPAYVTGVSTGTTPTLTPTTLANIEQTFIELQSVPVSTSGQDPLNQSGFVPPIVDPISGSDQTPGGTPDHYDYSDSDSEWMAPAHKTSRSDSGKAMSSASSYSSGRGRKAARHLMDDDYEFSSNVSPEEAERRRVRRERNKVAAAKCRQRRVDHTNRLINEKEQLEDEQSVLENEIQTLQQEKDRLEFILEAHQPLCKGEALLGKSRMKSEYQSSDYQSSCISDRNRGTNMPAIKQEIPDYLDDYTSDCTMKMDHHSRPSTLPLQSKSVVSRSSLVSSTGIPITTPTSGFFAFSSLDMESHSGLTPLGGPSCASQIHKSSMDTSPDGVSSPSLISL